MNRDINTVLLRTITFSGARKVFVNIRSQFSLPPCPVNLRT